MPAAHEPTETSRAEVKALSSFGNTQDQICSYLDIDVKTLHKYYRRELDTAVIQANAQVAKRLYNKAVNQDDLSAQVFWLKTRARWRTDDVDRLANENNDLKDELKELRSKLAEQSKREY